MPSKKVKKFCKLTKFLEQTDKDLHQAFDDLCLFGLFRTRGRGITFLYPDDKSYRKKIIEYAYSNNPEKAVEMVRSLVLLDYLPSPSDFASKKDDIPNSLNKKLEVESADSTTVKLKSGHKLVLDKSYVPLRSGEQVAVYKLSGSGELPTTGVASNMKYANKSESKSGGCSTQPNKAATLTESVENIYASEKTNSHNIYRAVVSMIYDSASNAPDSIKQKIYDRICASARASYYSIVAPWCMDTTHDHDLAKYIDNLGFHRITSCDMNELQKLLDSGTNDLYIKELEKFLGLGGINTYPNINRHDEAEKLLNKINNQSDTRREVLCAYNNDSYRLYKDLLTVFCFISAHKEKDDDRYFKSTFTYHMKYIFNYNTSFNETVNELVYNISLYYTLLRSDAFKYVPTTTHDTQYPNKPFCLDEMPKKEMFTIQFNDDLIGKYGGSEEEDNTFFGGYMRNL